MTSHPLFLITYKRMRALFLLLFGVIGLFFFGVHILQRGVYGRHGETQCLFPFLSSQRKGKRGCGDAFLLWELFRMHAYRIRIHGLWMIHDSQYGCFLSFFFLPFSFPASSSRRLCVGRSMGCLQGTRRTPKYYGDGGAMDLLRIHTYIYHGKRT